MADHCIYGFVIASSLKSLKMALSRMLQDLCKAGVECMTDMSGSPAGRGESYKTVIASILSLLLSILIVSFVGKYLWNVSVAELFTIARPVQSVWQIIALMLLMSLMR